MKSIFVLFILAFSLDLCLAADRQIDSLMQILDETIEMSPILESKKLEKIQNIKAMLFDNSNDKKEQYQICHRLVKAYALYNYDSTLRYINYSMQLSIALNDPLLINKSRLLEAELLAKSGDYKESLDRLHDVDRAILFDDQMSVYFGVYSKVYENLGYYASASEVSKNYQRIQEKYSDSLQQTLDFNSDQYLAILEKRYRDNRQLDKAREINDKRIGLVDFGTPLYSLVTFHRSLMSQLEGDKEGRKKYLVLSAISDILSVNKDNASLTELSLILFDENQLDRAYRYIKFSFSDVEIFNSKIRYMEIAHIFPVITEAYQNSIDEQNEKLKTLLYVISFLSMGLFISIFSVYRQMTKLKSARNDLRESNTQLKNLNEKLRGANEKLNVLNHQLFETDKVKEMYIGSFLNICSGFIDKLDNYRRMVRRMVTSRKFEELIERTTSQDMIDAEVASFYETFDKTFLHIFPDFVPKMNALLLVEERIELKSTELLNTEFRIFALIRLGIVDSSEISRMLRYSVNTIYNYRAKIKNKSAVPRDDFESYVMKIDAFANTEEDPLRQVES